jgi:phage terminase small subunit
MPVLDNPRHERFAHEIAKGTSQREAYRIAGYRVGNNASADASASRLLSDARISARVQEIQNAVSARTVEKTSVTKAWVIAKLVENDRAMEAEPVARR